MHEGVVSRNKYSTCFCCTYSTFGFNNSLNHEVEYFSLYHIIAKKCSGNLLFRMITLPATNTEINRLSSSNKR